MAYYGVKMRLAFLVAGYFLHGLWDLAYVMPTLLPVHHDLFCLAVDFTTGLYLAVLNYNVGAVPKSGKSESSVAL